MGAFTFYTESLRQVLLIKHQVCGIETKEENTEHNQKELRIEKEWQMNRIKKEKGKTFGTNESTYQQW